MSRVTIERREWKGALTFGEPVELDALRIERAVLEVLPRQFLQPLTFERVQASRGRDNVRDEESREEQAERNGDDGAEDETAALIELA